MVVCGGVVVVSVFFLGGGGLAKSLKKNYWFE